MKSVLTTEGEQIPPIMVNKYFDITNRTLLAWFCDGISKISWLLLSAAIHTFLAVRSINNFKRLL